MLFVPVDAEEGTFPFAWFVPSKAFARMSKVTSRKRRVFVASMKPDSKNRWKRYRFERGELPDQILAVIDQLAKRKR